MFWPLNQRDHSKDDRSERLDDSEAAWVLMGKNLPYISSSNLVGD